MVPFLLAAAVAAQAGQIGTFIVGQRADPMTDDVQALAILQDGSNSLSIGCNSLKSHRVGVYFQTADTMKTDLTSILTPMMSIRYDSDEVVYDQWNFQVNLAYIDIHKHVADFVKRLLTSKKIALRAKSLDGSNIDFVADVVDPKAALTQIANTCGDTSFTAIVSP